MPELKFMIAAKVTAVFKHIIQSSVSRDTVTDNFNTPEELDVIIVVLWCGCVGNLFFQLRYGRRSVDQWIFKGTEQVKVWLGMAFGFKSNRQLLS